MKHTFEDGDLLLLVGGPYDGEYRKVSVIFPFLDGGVPSSLLTLGDEWYSLDQENRQWVYVPRENRVQ